MDGRTHLLAGVTAGLALAHCEQLSLPLTAVAAMAGGLGGLVPDIDHKNSVLTQRTHAIGKTIGMMTKHRGFIHTPLFCFALPAVFHILLTEMTLFTPDCVDAFVFSLLVGMLSHLFLDMLNPMGIMVFYPASYKYFRLMRLRSGGKAGRRFSLFFTWMIAGFTFLRVMQLTVVQVLFNFFERILTAVTG